MLEGKFSEVATYMFNNHNSARMSQQAHGVTKKVFSTLAPRPRYLLCERWKDVCAILASSLFCFLG